MSFSPAPRSPWLLLLVCCGNGSTPPNLSPIGSVAPVHQAAPSPPICADAESLRAQFGHVCVITGTYKVKTFPGKRGGTLGDWPVIVLDDSSEVMIETLWDASKKPDTETLQRLQGKRVQVVGVLHPSPPREYPANFYFPCISPVHSQMVVP